MNDTAKYDTVSIGDRVYVNYDDIQHVEAIVSHIHDRKAGIISVRIPVVGLTNKQLRGLFQNGRHAALLLRGEEWEPVSKRIIS